MSETYKNCFDNPDSEFSKAMADLYKRKKILRTGEWTPAQENAMLLNFVREHISSSKGIGLFKKRDEYELPVTRASEDYVYSDMPELRGNYDNLFITAAYNLALEGGKVDNTNYLSCVMDALNGNCPLKGDDPEQWQKVADKRAILLHYINKTFKIPSYIVKGYNSESDQESLFVVMPGRFYQEDKKLSRDAWQIVNPASVSIVTIGNFGFSYPTRAFLNDDFVDQLCNRPTEFSIKYEAIQDGSNIRATLSPEDAKVATIKNIGNLDFATKNLQPVKKKVMEATR